MSSVALILSFGEVRHQLVNGSEGYPLGHHAFSKYPEAWMIGDLAVIDSPDYSSLLR